MGAIGNAIDMSSCNGSVFSRIFAVFRSGRRDSEMPPCGWTQNSTKATDFVAWLLCFLPQRPRISFMNEIRPVSSSMRTLGAHRHVLRRNVWTCRSCPNLRFFSFSSFVRVYWCCGSPKGYICAPIDGFLASILSALFGAWGTYVNDAQHRRYCGKNQPRDIVCQYGRDMLRCSAADLESPKFWSNGELRMLMGLYVRVYCIYEPAMFI